MNTKILSAVMLTALIATIGMMPNGFANHPDGVPGNTPEPVTNIQVVQMGAGERQFLHFTWDGARDGDVKFKFTSTVTGHNFSYQTDENHLNIQLKMLSSSHRPDARFNAGETITYKAQSLNPSYPTYSTQYTEPVTITICEINDAKINNSHC